MVVVEQIMEPSAQEGHASEQRSISTPIRNAGPQGGQPPRGGGRAARGGGRKTPIPPPPRATPSSSSGYPGVSWNKRMGAWLAFYYDADTRRSRTFHPKYYDFDVDKAKQAAIEFMQNIDKHPGCSLRKSRRDTKSNAFLNGKYDMDNHFGDLHGRTRKRGAANHMLAVDFKGRGVKGTLTCPPTPNPLPAIYDMDKLRHNFHVTADLLDQCYMSNSGTMETEYTGNTGVMDNNYLSGSFESQQDYDKGYQSPMTWQSCQSFFGNQEYYVDSQGYGNMSYLDGDMPYMSSEGTMYRETEPVYQNGATDSRHRMQSGEGLLPGSGEPQGQHMFTSSFDASPTKEEPDIRMLMHSIALTNGDSVEGYGMDNYQFGDSAANYSANPAQNFSANSNTDSTTQVNTPLGSPYFSPYVHTLYNHFPEDSELNRTFGFQNLILGGEGQTNQQTQSVMPPQS
ncbi:AP2 domain family protein [Babesia bovis T2Bo]|uniref:AP2/ERF domain-containing protein n=1 Tax=Babesia bovis TaxID=5865 RepID=A7AT57_BABBO|nr:AP2 domain family protein [Babesia bovis T2Bo]EDO06118.1 AP2 domain family protein [Babesia bovis T2Bo]|eukprot:XP_001609686.1 hypothetical protein [Babesia bovis T2Bo]